MQHNDKKNSDNNTSQQEKRTLTRTNSDATKQSKVKTAEKEKRLSLKISDKEIDHHATSHQKMPKDKKDISHENKPNKKLEKKQRKQNNIELCINLSYLVGKEKIISHKQFKNIQDAIYTQLLILDKLIDAAMQNDDQSVTIQDLNKIFISLSDELEHEGKTKTKNIKENAKGELDKSNISLTILDYLKSLLKEHSSNMNQKITYDLNQLKNMEETVESTFAEFKHIARMVNPLYLSCNKSATTLELLIRENEQTKNALTDVKESFKKILKDNGTIREMTYIDVIREEKREFSFEELLHEGQEISEEDIDNASFEDLINMINYAINTMKLTGEQKIALIDMLLTLEKNSCVPLQLEKEKDRNQCISNIVKSQKLNFTKMKNYLSETADRKMLNDELISISQQKKYLTEDMTKLSDQIEKFTKEIKKITGSKESDQYKTLASALDNAAQEKTKITAHLQKLTIREKEINHSLEIIKAVLKWHSQVNKADYEDEFKQKTEIYYSTKKSLKKELKRFNQSDLQEITDFFEKESQNKNYMRGEPYQIEYIQNSLSNTIFNKPKKSHSLPEEKNHVKNNTYASTSTSVHSNTSTTTSSLFPIKTHQDSNLDDKTIKSQTKEKNENDSHSKKHGPTKQ